MEDIVSSSYESRSVVLFATGIIVAIWCEDICRFGKRIRRSKTWLTAGKYLLNFDYQTIMVTWIVAMGNSGDMVKRSKVEKIRN